MISDHVYMLQDPKWSAVGIWEVYINTPVINNFIMTGKT